jgi:putative membrane protein
MRPAILIALGSSYLLMIAVLPVGWLSESGGGLLSLCLQGVSSLSPGSVWTAWSLAPAVTIPLAIAACAYLTHARGSDTREVALFAGGLVLLALALVSPLCRLAANLVSVHMIQHVILVAVAPPLLVLGMRTDRFARESAAARMLLARPGRCAAFYGVLIWLWHVPRFYEQALLDPRIHLLMYGSLITAAVLFWTSILSARDRGAQHGGWAMLALLTTFVHTGLLGALLSFSPRPWYPLLSASSTDWGLSPLEDQQLAGLIMWVPMGLVYLLAALWIASCALSHPGKRGAEHRPAAQDALIE